MFLIGFKLLGTGALIGKQDIETAFNLFPVQPTDFELLGIKFENKYWIQKMLPQGASISWSIFESFFVHRCCRK